jgi:thiol-disulfide isomerase/thioredoxin
MPDKLKATIIEQDHVLVLNDAIFEEAIRTYRPLLVLFDSPSRPGSLELYQQFSNAASSLYATSTEGGKETISIQNQLSLLRFGFMDVSVHIRAVDRYNVIGLPAIVRFDCGSSNLQDECNFTNGQVEKYIGGRSSMELQRFILDKPLKPVKLLSTRTQLQELIESNPLVLLVVIDEMDNQAFFDIQSLAQVDGDLAVHASTTNRELLETGVEKQQIPCMVMYRGFGKTRLMYTGNWRQSELFAFVQRNKYDYLSTYSSLRSGYFYDNSAFAHVLVFSDTNDSYHADLLEQTKQAAMKYYQRGGDNTQKNVRFIDIPLQEKVIYKAFFVTPEHIPAVLYLADKIKPSTRFPYFGEELQALIQTKSLANELIKFIDMQIETKQKENEFEDIEAYSNDETSVMMSKVIEIQSNMELENRIQQRMENVVVLFSSPRCYGCREFWPIYEELAYVVASGVGSWDRDSIPSFVKVNVDTTSVVSVKLTLALLPALYFYPIGQDEPFEFTKHSYLMENVFEFLEYHAPQPYSKLSKILDNVES